MVLSELKRVRKILPASRPHWVGNGFNVFPVFANLAFTNDLSPWLMFDCACFASRTRARRARLALLVAEGGQSIRVLRSQMPRRSTFRRPVNASVWVSTLTEASRR